MTISQAELDAARYEARDRDFIAVAGLYTNVEPLQLRSGKWRAYLSEFITGWSPRGQTAESSEVVRDNYGYIITEDTRAELITKLREEYPGWKWAT